jgi:hypothetical protein
MGRVVARRLASTALAIAVSAAVLWWLLDDGIGASFIEAASEASLPPLVFGGAIAIAIQIVRAWRFEILTSGEPTPPSWAMVVIASRLILLNFLLPFKLGELSFPLMMKRAYGAPFAKGAGILIVCRLLDLGAVVAIMLLAAAWLIDSQAHGFSPWILAGLGLIALLGPLLAADLLPRLRRLTEPWPRLHQMADQLSFGAAMMRPAGLRGLTAALTLSIWLGHALIAYLAASAIAAGLSFLSMAMASAASNLAFALPISGAAGLGPPQAAWAATLRLQGVAWPPAIASALLCHGVLLITLSAWGALTFFGPRADLDGPAGAGSPR